MGPSVCLAVMVRDDAERLRRCLRSAAGVVDEMLVLDTGSVDDTVEVARGEGARVESFAWTGSFADGLNALLDQVRTDWVLRLDSDEWFEMELAEPLRECVALEEAYGFNLVRRDLLPSGGYEEIGLMRLWRSHPLLRYRGVVHEVIPYPRFREAWPGMAEGQAPIWFWHDGYAGGQLEKIRRNVPLLERELEARPEQPHYEALLAKGYKDLGDPRWVGLMDAIVDRALGEERPTSRVQAVVFAEVLENLSGPRLMEPRTERLIERAWAWFGGFPSVVWAIANAQERRGRREEVLRALLRLAEMAETGEYDRSLPVGPVVLGKEMWKRLDRLADRMGRWEVCRRCEAHL